MVSPDNICNLTQLQLSLNFQSPRDTEDEEINQQHLMHLNQNEIMEESPELVQTGRQQEYGDEYEDNQQFYHDRMERDEEEEYEDQQPVMSHQPNRQMMMMQQNNFTSNSDEQT